MAKTHIENNIRKLRFMNNELTQQQLADKVDVTPQTIVAIENGKYSPTLELAFKIALIFDLPLDQVFTYEPLDSKSKNEKYSK